MRRRRGPLIRSPALVAIATLSGTVAFLARAYWVLRVQSPLDAIYSDMGGYFDRATMLLAGVDPPDPRLGAFYPWGAHVLYALELAATGRTSTAHFAIAHALVGSVPPVFAVLIASRLLRSRLALACLGLTAALWQPQVAIAGFFLSELWYSALLATGSWLFVRHAEGRSGALVGGCVIAYAFAVRPQILLTVVLVPALALAARLGRVLGGQTLRLRPRRWSPARLALLVAPLVVIVAGSSIRLYRLSGQLGLISQNGALMRIFGETAVTSLQSTWTAPNGLRITQFYAPGWKHPHKPPEPVAFEGYIGDDRILERIRRERLEGVSLGRRLWRMRYNVERLVNRNFLWPEENHAASDPRRATLQRTFRILTFVALPLAAIGLVAIRRHRAVWLLFVAHLITVVGVASIYMGDVRYRVPYDPLLLVAAAVGAATLAGAPGALLRRVRDRGATRSA